jgi:hypothetical protein
MNDTRSANDNLNVELKFSWLENCEQARALVLYLSDMVELYAAKTMRGDKGSWSTVIRYLDARAEVYSISHERKWFDYE